MSTATATAPIIELNEEQKRSAEMVFELTNRSKSQWVRKGDERSPNPRHMNSPRTVALPMTSRKYLGTGLGYTDTQYVPGANTYFVEDYMDEKSGKMLPGLKTQKYDLDLQRRRAMQMNIHFLFGKLDLRKFGEDPVLLGFVNDHENNVESTANTLPGGKDRRKIQQFNFQPLRKEEKAQKLIVNFDTEVEAMNFVARLRAKTAKGYDYNVDLMNAVCGIFEIGQGLTDMDTNQKMEVIVSLVKRNSLGFINAVNETFEEYKMAVATAMKYGVLQVTSKDAKITIDNQATLIKELKGSNQDEKTMDLICHFIGDEKGRQNYNSLCGETELKKAQSLSKK